MALSDQQIYIIILAVILLFVILLILYFQPSWALIPFNTLIHLLNNNQPIYSVQEMQEIFPHNSLFAQNWQDIRAEALNVLPQTQGNLGQNFISKSADFWDGWNAFPLRINGHDIVENQRLCPITSQLLQQCEEIPMAFFSVLQPGKVLPEHKGPYAGILRYHLGLQIPQSEPHCSITVNNTELFWQDGESLFFDETYSHSARNPSSEPRIILFMDVVKPMRWHFLHLLNKLVLWLMQNSPHTHQAINQAKEKSLQYRQSIKDYAID